MTVCIHSCTFMIPQSLEEGIGSSGTGVTGNWNLLCGCWKLNLISIWTASILHYLFSPHIYTILVSVHSGFFSAWGWLACSKLHGISFFFLFFFLSCFEFAYQAYSCKYHSIYFENSIRQFCCWLYTFVLLPFNETADRQAYSFTTYFCLLSHVIHISISLFYFYVYHYFYANWL